MAKAKVDIPWPNENYVAYNWPAGGGSWAGDFWERRRQKAISALKVVNTSYSDNIPELIELGKRVEAIGKAERQKELNFLRQNLPDFDFTNIDEKKLVTTINEIVRGEEQFRFALTRIKAAIELGKTKNKKGEDYKGLAPTMASIFMSYLGTTFTDEMRNIAKQFPLEEAVSHWKTNLDVMFERAVDRAMEKALEESEMRREQDEAYGDATQWREIGEAYKQLQGFQNQFKNMLKKQLRLEDLRTFFDTQEHQKILKKTRRNKKKTGGFRRALGWESQELYNNIGGNVHEYIESLIEQMAPKSATITEKGGTVAQGKVQKIDMMSFYEYEAEVNANFEQLFYELENYMQSSTSLEDAARRFQEFYDSNLSKLSQNNFYIVTNAKMASLGSGFGGLHNGGRVPLEKLGDYIEMANISTDKAKDFINMAYNTLPTAIFEDQREAVQENIRNILTAAAARLLFDDWSTIGVENPGTQILNFFNIDGLIIPSSLFFTNLGKAMVETAESLENKNTMRTWFSVYVRLPKTVVYKNEPGRWSGLGDTNEEIKRGIWRKWEEQAEKAKAESYFESKFLFNFKSLVSRWT